MRAANALVLAFLALLAFVVAQENDIEWTVDADHESPVDSEAPSRMRRSTCPGTTFKLSATDRRRVVREHNKLRRAEGASNMLELTWSNTMAKRAHQWASKCLWAHGMMRDCNGEPIGQNLYLAQGRGAANVNITHVIANAWFSEKRFYNYNTRRCRAKMCGHYEEIVRANRYKVGCSVVHCSKVMNRGVPWHNAVIVACDYKMKDIDGLRSPYFKGSACSRCGDMVRQAYSCRRGLCEECDPKGQSGCKCREHLNCFKGRYSSSQCKCICPKDYWGLKCDKRCGCRNKLAACSQYTSKCDDKSWVDFMSVNCPATCPQHCPKPPPGVCNNSK